MSRGMFKWISGSTRPYALRFLGVLLYLVFISQETLLAQDPAEKGLPFITNYYPKDFKALTQAWAVIESNEGIMYFGMQNTILEYDGVRWRKVPTDFKTTSNVIRAFGKDKDGTIYFGAIGDLGYFDTDSLGHTVGRSLLSSIPQEFQTFNDIWSIYCGADGVY